MLPDLSLLVEHPSGDRRVRAFEPPKHLADGGARDRVVPAAAELGQRGTEHHLCHGAIVGRVMSSRRSVVPTFDSDRSAARKNRSAAQKEVQEDRPDDRDHHHQPDRDEHAHVLRGLPRERSRQVIDAEPCEKERAEAHDRQHGGGNQQHLPRGLHGLSVDRRPTAQTRRRRAGSRRPRAGRGTAAPGTPPARGRRCPTTCPTRGARARRRG